MGTVAEFAYDALGRRISKTVDGKTTYYYYDTMGRNHRICKFKNLSPILLMQTAYFSNAIFCLIGFWEDLQILEFACPIANRQAY
ncbi:MAG: hypothetical protein ACYC54_09625 [Sedimentisphaerales bacterium]